jgi:signal transduction histidine kinase
MLQRQHGLDVLPVSNGGRTVSVFQTGQPFLTGQLRSDPDELRGLKEALAIQSEIGVPLDVGGARRGMLMLASQKPNFWNEDDLRFSEAVARWVGLLAHRAELAEQIATNAVEALAVKALGRLGAIIGDMLDVARIDQGVLEIEPQPIALVSFVEEIATAIATPDHAIHVLSPEELVVMADPRRIRQCIENLLTNALNHSPKDASVTGRVTRVARDNDETAHVEIIDEGPGIAPDVAPRIFERFVTGQRKEGGLGLGLFLAKRIAALHNGDLTFESQPGKGARFRLVLPLYDGSIG